MRFLNVLKRESPLVVGREILWRAQREWNRRRTPDRLKNLAHARLRIVPFYNPDLRAISAHSRTIILSFADEIRAGRYPFFGYDTPDLGTKPRWNLDFVTGAEWPYMQYEGRGYVRKDGSDVKVPYELSRLQFLPVLGKAYVLSGEPSYRDAAKDLLSHWIQSNPAFVGVHWTIPMEAALRAMSVCFLLNLLSPFHREEQPWLDAVNLSLVQHLAYIEGYIEFSHLISSNHYLSDIVGLYCLSLFLEGDGMPARRREYRKKIETEMAKQVYDDGGDYEAATGYQVLVTQLFSTALLLMRAENAAAPAPAFLERLRRMFRFLNAVASPSGELPHIGDCDDGRTELLTCDLHQMLLAPVSQRNSLRIPHLLGLGKQLFREGRGAHDAAAWYGLTNTSLVLDSEPQRSCKRPAVEVLPRAGIGVLRHGPAELLFLAIPNGIFGKGSHTHNDKLSFILRVAGQDILCDPGTGCYTRDVALRNRFRSTASHNTLLIDGEEQNRIFPGLPGLFLLGNQAAVSRLKEGHDARGIFLQASHEGYRSLGVLHTRTVRVDGGEPAFVVEDELTGSGVHDVELNFQLASSRAAEVLPADDGILCRITGEPEVHLYVTGPCPFYGAIWPASVSTAYGATVPAVRVQIRGRMKVPARIVTRIFWGHRSTARFHETKSKQTRALTAAEGARAI